jgi:hypothetical protein
MKFEQKRQLSVALANLPIARQARVVQIVSDLAQTQDDEIELDLDQMDNTTLWRLFDYVFPKSQQLAMGITHDELVLGAPSAAPAAAPPPKPSTEPVASSCNNDDEKPAAAAADAAMADAPMADAPAIIADVAVRKEVIIQNASSWAVFAAQGDAAAGNGPAAAGDATIPDALWSEFARKEAEKVAREAAAMCDRACREYGTHYPSLMTCYRDRRQCAPCHRYFVCDTHIASVART